MSKEMFRAFRQAVSGSSRSEALERLGQRLGASAPPPELAILLGLICAAASFGVRALFSSFLGEGEYFLTAYPFILILTLTAGRWAGWSCLLSSLFAGWFLFIGEPFTFMLGPHEGGILVGSFIVGAITVRVADILRSTFAELALAREHDRLVSRELEHRVKNTLTLVLTLSRQTFRKDAAIDVARAEFEGRIMALAAAQSILGDAAQDCAPLREVVARCLAPFCGGRSDRLVATGPDAMLGADAAMGLCLVFHELATNASKYGALSNDQGSIRLSWVRTDRELKIIWQERGGPPVAPPKRSGFGSQLFDKIVARQLKGNATIDFAETGVQARIVLPLADPPTSAKGAVPVVTPAPRRA